MSDPGITLPAEAPEDRELDQTLRPRTLDEYIGQADVKANLSIVLEAARGRGEAVEHILISGPPGLGKTTLAQVIANQLGAQIRVTSGPAIEHQGALASVMTSLEERDVFFIDEVHRLGRLIEESLYPAMEDFVFDWVSGKGAGAVPLRLPLKRFTVVGATTRLGLLSAPLRDRFGIAFRLEFYSEDEMAQIVGRSAGILGVDIDPEGITEVARRARGTPRVANRLLRRVRDFAQVRASGHVDGEVARQALEMLDVDPAGLDRLDRRFLLTVIDKFQGGPVGLGTLATALAEDQGTLEEVVEPFLVQRGFLKRTPRGRVAGELAYAHLGRPAPRTPPGQPGLFEPGP
ncbi:MAG: Holliday junction branch migration DNA helicase RuvB [Candidatus Dormibacteria bacterium]